MKYRYRKEEEMKDSGVEWIGKIPKDWNISRIGLIANVKSSRRIYESEYKYMGIPFYRSKEIVDLSNGKEVQTEIFISDELYNKHKDKYSVPKKGDILITSIGTIGRTWISDGRVFYYKDGNITQIDSNNKINIKFIQYCFASNILKQQYNMNSDGSTVMALTIDKIRNLKLLNTSLNEQKIIANFLDKKTAQFDSIISKKEALIQRLEEAKKSLISEIVTGKVKVVKTSDGYELVKRKKEEMKDSGVEWLGDVPKEWDLERGKWLFYNSNEKGSEKNTLLSATQDRGVIPKKLVEGAVQNKEDTDFTNFKLVKKYDFIISLRSFQGGFEMSEYDNGIITPAYSVLRNKVVIEPYYYKYVLKEKGFIGIINSLTVGIRDGKNIKYDDFSNVILPNPALYEQQVIAFYIKKTILQMNSLINKTSNQIKKLKEARQSLISEAVTGKIEILD